VEWTDLPAFLLILYCCGVVKLNNFVDHFNCELGIGIEMISSLSIYLSADSDKSGKVKLGKVRIDVQSKLS
jgi:hypothetical protein